MGMQEALLFARTGGLLLLTTARMSGITPTVFGRPGDARFLKAILAAKLSGAELRIEQTAAAQDQGSAAPFRLELGDGGQLTDPNAIGRLLGDWGRSEAARWGRIYCKVLPYVRQRVIWLEGTLGTSTP